MSDWLDLMLEEIARKEREAREAQEELARRESKDKNRQSEAPPGA